MPSCGDHRQNALKSNALINWDQGVPRGMSMKSSEQRTQLIVEEFTSKFQQAPTMMAVGPGRVNLIGEHTDYNDGFVLPVAIKRDVRIALRPREDRIVKVYSLEYDDWFEFSLDDLRYNHEKLWTNY